MRPKISTCPQSGSTSYVVDLVQNFLYVLNKSPFPRPIRHTQRLTENFYHQDRLTPLKQNDLPQTFESRSRLNEVCYLRVGTRQIESPTGRDERKEGSL